MTLIPPAPANHRNSNLDYNSQFALTGKMFQWQYNSAFIAGVTDLRIKTSTGQIVHVIARSIMTASTGISIQLVEDAVIVSTGITTLPIYNVDRIIGTTSKTIVYSNLSATSGTSLENVTLPPQDTWRQTSPELILKSDSNYTLRVNNSGSTAIPVDFMFVWYESNN